ncbi:hypothetical protein N7527_001437 [Penicillium freii]|uniref:Myb-like DNA-binding domain-containing protein n=1 Tax=Penicillium freii TaxID=48697 RepID=A0A101MR86_PENFR|nr:hypothetical protein N7527_001437 [Penicillium freii]KUM65239.1 hypothetical protein ACN42_g1837 [Penicillium freii]
MAKEPTTQNKATKPVKAGIVKRTPAKAKIAPANVSPTIGRDLVFLWKCVKMSTGMKIDWPAVAKDAGKSVGTVQKQWSRLNMKLEKSVHFNTSDSDKDATDKDAAGKGAAAADNDEE